jgi:hypothetical protein
MSKNFLKFYKIPLLLSFALAVVLTAVSVETEYVKVAFIVLGCFAGTFLLDLDYLIHAYFVEPNSPQAGVVKDYLKHKDVAGYFLYVQSHKHDFQNKTLNSGLFQIVLGAFVLFATGYGVLIVKALLLSTFLNSIYKMTENYFHNNAQDWFWNLKIDTRPRSMYLYMIVMVLVLFSGIWFF